MVQIYKKILIGKGIEEKIKRKTATNHHNKQQQLAPPPCPSPKGRGVKSEVPLVVSILFAISG